MTRESLRSFCSASTAILDKPSPYLPQPRRWGHGNDERPSRSTASSKVDVPVSIQSRTGKRQTIMRHVLDTRTGIWTVSSRRRMKTQALNNLDIVSYNWHQPGTSTEDCPSYVSHGSARATILQFGLSLVPHFTMHQAAA
jgi:hypothetical protein